MKAAIWFIASLMVLVIIGCGIGEEDDDDDPSLIIPGKQAGGFKMGDLRSKVISLYGESERSPSHHFLGSYLSIGTEVYYYADDEGDLRVHYIFVQSPNQCRTAGGNGIGSSLASVEREFGSAEEIGGDWNNEHWYRKKGINFTVGTDNGKVWQIFIFERG